MGSLLLGFLPTSLQEQISSRKYFYKSGRLIKDGIITLSNTDFSRDIMDQVCLCAAFLMPPHCVVTLGMLATLHLLLNACQPLCSMGIGVNVLKS